MKKNSKFKLEIPLACQGCVAPACGILLGLAVSLIVIIFAANHNTLACHAV
jgi:hypothetical protein